MLLSLDVVDGTPERDWIRFERKPANAMKIDLSTGPQIVIERNRNSWVVLCFANDTADPFLVIEFHDNRIVVEKGNGHTIFSQDIP